VGTGEEETISYVFSAAVAVLTDGGYEARDILLQPCGQKGDLAIAVSDAHSFRGFGRDRCLCRDFEYTAASSEIMVRLASIHRTLKLFRAGQTVGATGTKSFDIRQGGFHRYSSQRLRMGDAAGGRIPHAFVR